MEKKCFSSSDAFVLAEINKHKWIESEKAGRDIGFMRAAEDWLAKFGGRCQENRGGNRINNRIFIEKRSFRRFDCFSYAKLVNGGFLSFAKVINLSFWGLLCRSANEFILGDKARIYLKFGVNNEEPLNCIGVVSRVRFDRKSKVYEVFFKFAERNTSGSIFA
ncbi:MAG: PilZ domain-containing protein [Candidatus Omnitrophica bacterium]|nr:PilZ domain-containing protein [Candidatus Omnitrophota bacterium]